MPDCIPHSIHPVGSPQSSEEGFQTICEPGNKMPQSGQLTGQLLDPFLGAAGQRFQDGLKLRRISHKAKESVGIDSEGTF